MAKVRDLIKQLGKEVLDMEAVGVVLVMATDGAPSVAGTPSPELAKKLLEVALSGDWPIARTIN